MFCLGHDVLRTIQDQTELHNDQLISDSDIASVTPTDSTSPSLSTMTDPQQKPISPISQLLESIGLTREDLHRHSDQMRQFLTAENPTSLRVFSREDEGPVCGIPKRAASSLSSLSRSISHPHSSYDTSPPATPIKSEPTDAPISLRNFESMEMVIERQSKQSRREKRARKIRGRSHTIPSVHHSPSPRSALSYPGFSLDSFMQSRDVRRVSASESRDYERTTTPQVSRTCFCVARRVSLMQRMWQDAWGAPPVTPKRCSYYRDHNADQTFLSHSRKVCHLTVSRSRSSSRSRIRFHQAHGHATTPNSPQPSLLPCKPLLSVLMRPRLRCHSPLPVYAIPLPQAPIDPSSTPSPHQAQWSPFLSKKTTTTSHILFLQVLT